MDHNDNRQDIGSHISDIKYPYAKWMLEEIKGEYYIENERESKIATKAGAFITVIVAIITLYIPMIPFENMESFFSNASISGDEKSAAIRFLTLLAIGMLLFLAAFVSLVMAYTVKGYNRVCVDDLITNSIQSEKELEESVLAQAMVAHYHKILRGTIDTKGNMKINTDSANAVTVGIVCTVFGFVVLSIATIALRIIIV